jgi:hypothetical protein
MESDYLCGVSFFKGDGNGFFGGVGNVLKWTVEICEQFCPYIF